MILLDMLNSCSFGKLIDRIHLSFDNQMAKIRYASSSDTLLGVVQSEPLLPDLNLNVEIPTIQDFINILKVVGPEYTIMMEDDSTICVKDEHQEIKYGIASGYNIRKIPIVKTNVVESLNRINIELSSQHLKQIVKMRGVNKHCKYVIIHSDDTGLTMEFTQGRDIEDRSSIRFPNINNGVESKVILDSEMFSTVVSKNLKAISSSLTIYSGYMCNFDFKYKEFTHSINIIS